MIKPEDLKFGNQLRNTRIKTIVHIDHQDIEWCFKENNYFNEVHKPIQITPDVLENAGFYKLKSVANKWVYKFSDEIYCSFYFHDGIHHFKWCSNFLVKIKSFHHLQNIIYDLTGIELTLNK